MQAGAEIRHQAKLAPIGFRFRRETVSNRKETVDAADVGAPAVERPCHDDFVADIGMNFAAVSDDCRIDVVKETGEQVLHPQFSHRFGKRGRSGEIEKHQRPQLSHGTPVAPERDIEQHPAADQPRQFENRPDQDREDERDRHDPRKSRGQPARLDPMAVEQSFQGKCHYGDGHGHARGPHGNIDRQRPAADPCAAAGGEIKMYRPAGEREAHPVQRAARIVGHRRLDRLIAEIANGGPRQQAEQRDDDGRASHAGMSPAATRKVNPVSGRGVNHFTARF